MKMSIDEAIAWINTDDFHSKGFADATSVAIDVMRKYQNIEQIAKPLKELAIDEISNIEREILEVLEDDEKID